MFFLWKELKVNSLKFGKLLVSNNYTRINKTYRKNYNSINSGNLNNLQFFAKLFANYTVQSKNSSIRNSAAIYAGARTALTAGLTETKMEFKKMEITLITRGQGKQQCP